MTTTYSSTSLYAMSSDMQQSPDGRNVSSQLMQLLGSGKSSHTPSSSASASDICATPKSRKSTSRRVAPAARRNLFVATTAQPVRSLPSPSKHSSRAVSPSEQLMQVLCVTPKSSTSTTTRSNSDNGQRHTASTGCMSTLSSPSIYHGRKVNVQELFGASTSANSSPKKYDADGEIAAFLTFADVPKSPNRPTYYNSAIFSTPTTHHPQHLRRQQSASATLTTSGGRNGGLRTAASTAAFCATISSFRRFTPPPGKEMSSPIFAASKYAESPSARSLPLPPDEWIQEALRRKTHAVIAESALEDDGVEPPTRLSFFLEASSEEQEDEDALSTASSGVVFDLDEAMAEDGSMKLAPTPLLPVVSAAGESASVDSGEGSMTSASDNECDSVIESAGIHMDPFSLIATVTASVPAADSTRLMF